MTPTIVYTTVQEFLDALTPTARQIIDTLREQAFDAALLEEVMQWNCLVRKFPNGNWIYCNAYGGREYAILGVWQGVALLADYPALRPLFDEVKKMVAKIELHSCDEIDQKGIAELVWLLYDRSPGS